MNENDIWNGYRLGESKEKTNDVYYLGIERTEDK